MQLHGGGGEIYRNFWHLSERALSIQGFLKSQFDRMDYSICTDRFDKRTHFAMLEEKIQGTLAIDGHKITRQQADMLYPLFRVRYWQSINNTINNQFTHALTPFVEPKLVFQSFSIPLRYKNVGHFQAALIRHIDVEIAKYPSVYGYNFYNEIGASRKLKDFLIRNTPLGVRPFLRRQKGRKKYHKPYYLQEKYLDGILRFDELAINEFVKVRQLEEPNFLSRALSLELLIGEKL
jgi:asparagine synthase (glutamine-hydrolysing)